MNTEAWDYKKFKFDFKGWYQALNAGIYRVQKVIGRFYSQYFTMYAALLFSLGAGACLGFTGDNCYGKIPFNAPVFWCLLLVVIFFFFQTFLLIPLTFGRLSRLLVVAVCGHYLTYQAYGFWSLANVETVIHNLSSIPASQINSVVFDSNLLEVANGIGVCKPYAYANIAYGHFWLNAPAMALILICFFAGNTKTEIEE